MSWKLLALACLLSASCVAQETDSLEHTPIPDKNLEFGLKDTVQMQPMSKDRRPSRAMLRSAIIPGWGQFYNGKWSRWIKIPVIYGGFATLGLMVRSNHRNYQIFLREAQYREANPGKTENQNYSRSSTTGILAQKDSYRRDRDLCLIGLVVWYGFNIIDAYVQAKFFHYDISNRLAIDLQPGLIQAPSMAYQVGLGYAPGLNMKFSW